MPRTRRSRPYVVGVNPVVILPVYVQPQSAPVPPPNQQQGVTISHQNQQQGVPAPLQNQPQPAPVPPRSVLDIIWTVLLYMVYVVVALYLSNTYLVPILSPQGVRINFPTYKRPSEPPVEWVHHRDNEELPIPLVCLTFLSHPNPIAVLALPSIYKTPTLSISYSSQIYRSMVGIWSPSSASIVASILASSLPPDKSFRTYTHRDGLTPESVTSAFAAVSAVIRAAGELMGAIEPVESGERGFYRDTDNGTLYCYGDVYPDRRDIHGLKHNSVCHGDDVGWLGNEAVRNKMAYQYMRDPHTGKRTPWLPDPAYGMPDNVSWAEVLRIGMDAARGCAVLHEFSEGTLERVKADVIATREAKEAQEWREIMIGQILKLAESCDVDRVMEWERRRGGKVMGVEELMKRVVVSRWLEREKLPLDLVDEVGGEELGDEELMGAVGEARGRYREYRGTILRDSRVNDEGNVKSDA